MNGDDEPLTLIEDCEALESRLSDWERGFISNLHAHVGGGGTLSARQLELLSSIWDRVTSTTTAYKG